MQPDEAPQASADIQVVETAPVADVVPAAPSEESQGPKSIVEIGQAQLAAAQVDAAEVEVETPTPTEESAPSPSPKPERLARQRFTLQGALDLVRSLRAQNRDAEIPPEALGLVRAYDADVIARHETVRQQEQTYKDTYLAQLALEATDPAAALARHRANPGMAAFMDAYQKAHPEVTLDNPDVVVRPQVDPVQLRQQVDGEYRSAFAEFAGSLAEEFEIPAEKMTEIGAKGMGPFGVLNDLVAAAVERGVQEGLAKELPKRVAEEAKAIRLEEQARYAGRTIIVPRLVPGGVPALSTNGRDPSAPTSMQEAGREAIRQLEAV